MKKSFLKLFLLAFFFLIIRNSFAQSFVSATENISIKIVNGISITVSEKLKKNNKKKYFGSNFKNTNRNLLVSYEDSKGIIHKTSTSLHLSTRSANTTLTIGEQTELKYLAENEHLHINIDESKELNSKHFVTIVY